MIISERSLIHVDKFSWILLNYLYLARVVDSYCKSVSEIIVQYVQLCAFTFLVVLLIYNICFTFYVCLKLG